MYLANIKLNDLYIFSISNNPLQAYPLSHSCNLFSTSLNCLLGVSHVTVQDDFAGIATIVSWLSYIPKVRPSCYQKA